MPRVRIRLVINTERGRGIALRPEPLLLYPSVSSFILHRELAHFVSTLDMGDQSGSTRFRALFESVLQAYEEQTGIALAEHPLTVRLRNCRSVGSITSLLQDQIPASSDLGRDHRIMTSIKSTISILATLSTAPAFAWAIGLVRQNPLTYFPQF